MSGVNCYVASCSAIAQPEHTPCCSSRGHEKPLCCRHYCNLHWVEVNRCSPESHAAVTQ